MCIEGIDRYTPCTDILFMATSTALAYQMMIEEKMLSAMVNAEQRGHFRIACGYALVHADFISADPNAKLPSQPLGSKNADEDYAAWQNFYFELLGFIGKTAKQTLIDVRVKYGKKGSGNLPESRK